MARGITLFKCDECGKKFLAPDIEYMATCFSCPMTCPQCGSNHTMPAGLFSIFGKANPQRVVYKQIWRKMDNQNNVSN